MLPLILLLAGLAFALTSRILLFIAAIKVGVGWAIGVWVPFGPFFFRRTFPEQSRSSAPFRALTTVCFVLYLFLGSDSRLNFYKRKDYASIFPQSDQATGYAMERESDSDEKGEGNLDERRAANAKELDRLSTWSGALHLKKRDLLRSDVEGNRAYEAELAKYNDAFAKATAEKTALAPTASSH